jgi:hypothetical protein
MFAAAGPPARMISVGDPEPELAPGWTSSSGTLWAIMARAASAPGGEAEYGAIIATGCPQGPWKLDTLGGPLL